MLFAGYTPYSKVVPPPATGLQSTVGMERNRFASVEPDIFRTTKVVGSLTEGWRERESSEVPRSPPGYGLYQYSPASDSSLSNVPNTRWRYLTRHSSPRCLQAHSARAGTDLAYSERPAPYTGCSHNEVTLQTVVDGHLVTDFHSVNISCLVLSYTVVFTNDTRLDSQGRLR